MSVTRLHGASPRFVILNDSNAYRGDAGSLRQPVRKAAAQFAGKRSLDSNGRTLQRAPG